MKALQNISKKLLDGILVGIGAGIAMSFIFWAFAFVLESGDEDYLGIPATPEFTSESRIKVIDDDLMIVDESTAYITGTLKNEDLVIWRNISVEVELLDAEEKLVDEFKEIISMPLLPGQEEMFKVTISYCGTKPLPVFDHYRIKPVSAYASLGVEPVAGGDATR